MISPLRSGFLRASFTLAHAAMAAVLLGLVSVDAFAVPAPDAAPAAVWVGADDPRIAYSDYVRLQIVAGPENSAQKAALFDRLLDMPGKGYRWDSPGSRVRFRTNATAVSATFASTGLHISTSARNGEMLCYIDGRRAAVFGAPAATSADGVRSAAVRTELPRPDHSGWHDYELILPYGDSVAFEGLHVDAAARFETVTPRPAVRYVAYGDSVTHGFSASDVGRTYPFLVAQEKNWELLNLGVGGRCSTGTDGNIVGALNPNIVTVLIGVNDWQTGVPVARYRANMAEFIDGLRAVQPQVPVYVLTPLWVAESWRPAKRVADLEDYREALRALVRERRDRQLHLIEGPSLIDPLPELFDLVAVHPNDAGFASLAERLAIALPSAGRHISKTPPPRAPTKNAAQPSPAALDVSPVRVR